MFALYNIALVYPYVQHDILMSSMNLQNVYYIKDESTKLLLYVQLHLFILKSNMLFLCPGWIYGKYAISNIILLCPGWIYEMFTIWIYTCLCLCPTWVSYVKDETTKWLLYVILHMFNLMSNMIFLCQGWIYKMYHTSNMIFLCPWWIYGKYAYRT